MKKFIPIEPTRDENHIRLETGFEEGGMNWYNGQNSRKGYYLYCTPVSVIPQETSTGMSYNSITETLGKGGKLLLKEVTRRSKKAEAESELIAEQKADYLVKQVCEQYGLRVIETAEG